MPNHSNSYLQLLLFFLPLVMPMHTSEVEADDGVRLADIQSNRAAWQALPHATLGESVPLPTWARMLATRLPLSTAALLELDFAQRTQSPVAADLRAAMRFMVAQANGCEYAAKAAMLDLHAAGANQVQRDSLADATFNGWSTDQQNALLFARNMSIASSNVTDDDFAALVKAYGENQSASMVLLTAYANMQDRLLMCLGTDAAIDAAAGTLAPVAVSFSSDAFNLQRRHPPATESPELPKLSDADTILEDGSWSALTYDQLQERLAKQRAKPTRLAIPEWSKVAANLPNGMFDRPSDIVWYRIVFGYAPELAIPFERFMRISGAETSSNYGRIFGTSLFWIVTRSVECPYCMGHCEMNWEVAGLSLDQIAERSQKLASEDWSGFPEQQQRAFAFARKLSLAPDSVSPNDLTKLVKDHGPELALSIALHTSRYHYMTRISNGFQLKLESENVFFDYWNKQRLASRTSPEGKPFVTIASDSEIWTRLPKLANGETGWLPTWAKAIATQMPRTAAAMLELDYAQRVSSPLDPHLRAKMRWVIAKANRCEYSQAYAIADLKHIGGTDAVCETLVGSPANWPIDDREPLEFARLMTVAAPTIEDAMFERLKNRFGERQVAAMVLLCAYGNFQDRIVLGLNLRLGEQEPLPPLPIKFADGALQLAPILPENRGSDTYRSPGQSIAPSDDAWTSVTFDELQRRLERQRQRTPRLPIPSWEDVASELPPAMAAKPTRIRWSLVTYGYAPELAVPWTIATRTHWSESPAERILEESAFWVQTRAIGCNYCMGHCEMLLEEAGLDHSAVAHRTQLLAESDWSTFPVAEQYVYAYARKLTQSPWELTAADYQSLVDEFGPQKAMGIFWWLCRGLYMTRISDGFQLPLEQDNVFLNHGSATVAEDQ